MTEAENAGLNLEDSDSLPWLETADGYEYGQSNSPLKVAGLVLAGLALLAAIVAGIYYMQRNRDGGAGNGEVIAAQEGDYKVAPSNPEGKKFEGEGDAAFAASEGKKAAVNIDPAKVKAAEKPAAAGADAPATAPAAPAAAAGSGLVQVGAYNSQATANEDWAALNKRFGALSGVGHKVAEATGEGGRKIFRLQAIVADAAAAQQLCAKLKAAGEGCMVVK